jgi:hypothetical protein
MAFTGVCDLFNMPLTYPWHACGRLCLQCSVFCQQLLQAAMLQAASRNYNTRGTTTAHVHAGTFGGWQAPADTCMPPHSGWPAHLKMFTGR